MRLLVGVDGTNRGEATLGFPGVDAPGLEIFIH
jgi:hypothetical protein